MLDVDNLLSHNRQNANHKFQHNDSPYSRSKSHILMTNQQVTKVDVNKSMSVPPHKPIYLVPPSRDQSAQLFTTHEEVDEHMSVTSHSSHSSSKGMSLEDISIVPFSEGSSTESAKYNNSQYQQMSDNNTASSYIYQDTQKSNSTFDIDKIEKINDDEVITTDPPPGIEVAPDPAAASNCVVM